MRDASNTLFASGFLRDVLEQRLQGLEVRVRGIPSSAVLTSDLADLALSVAAEVQIQPIQLHEDRISASAHEAEVDVSDDPHRDIMDRSRPFIIQGSAFVQFIPFDGDPMLLRLRPSTLESAFPSGRVEDQCIIVTLTVTNTDSLRIKTKLEKNLAAIKSFLTRTRQEVEQFNAEAIKRARRTLEVRHGKLIGDQAALASLGFPLQRSEPPATYAPPEIRRKILPAKFASTAPASTLEPAILLGEYEYILGVILGMVKQIERSPRTFLGMDEEALRTMILVSLNGHYEGQATGETFNAKGKTDILIRVKDKNVFIAECKIWDGPASLAKAIDQLLSYATWRDGKLALLIFNRNKNFTAVLSSIAAEVSQHPHFLRKVDYVNPTGLRIMVKHPNDEQRECMLTILAFDVPTEPGTAGAASDAKSAEAKT